MKNLFNQFIQFYQFFSNLTKSDKEKLDNELSNLISKANKIDDLIKFNLDNDSTLLQLYKKFVRIFIDINKENSNVIELLTEQDKFKNYFTQFCDFLSQLKDVDNEYIKEVIEQRTRQDKQYANTLKNSLGELIPVVNITINEVITNQSKQPEQIAIDRTVTGSQLAEIFDCEPATINYHLKHGEFPNYTQKKGKGTKLSIPWKDIDEFVLRYNDYLNKWNEYKRKMTKSY